MITKLGLYYRSLRYLKIKQVYYRVYYFTRTRFRAALNYKYDYDLSKSYKLVKLDDYPKFNNSYIGRGRFKFLNLEHQFDQIDWDFAENGKLWTYNLNYFDFINQESSSVESSKILMQQFVAQLPVLLNANEPYPISLRIINWVKFLSNNSINNTKLSNSLYAQAKILEDKLEYHLLGNHLLENGFGLLFASVFFQDVRFYKTAKKIISKELDEQILNDGAHFELSPMYHQIILLRMLDAYNLLKNNPFGDPNLIKLIAQKAELMLAWLSQISFNDGSIPMLNDSAYDITPGSNILFEYAANLGLDHTYQISLKESGYRKFKNEKIEMIIDFGAIGPSYIPGHAHADTFNFVINYNDKPFIVDLGTSTYEANELRLDERSTKSHNTVEYNNTNSSEIWSSFRVGSRASITKLKAIENGWEASHDGYSSQNCTHQRSFIFKDRAIVVKDELSNKEISKSYLHFHPEVEIGMDDSGQINFSHGSISFESPNGALVKEDISLKDYNFAQGFNRLRKSKAIEVVFKGELTTTISYN